MLKLYFVESLINIATGKKINHEIDERQRKLLYEFKVLYFLNTIFSTQYDKLQELLPIAVKNICYRNILNDEIESSENSELLSNCDQLGYLLQLLYSDNPSTQKSLLSCLVNIASGKKQII